jgi:hypothetical protein
LWLAAERQIVERDEDGESVGHAAGRGQTVGEQAPCAVVVSLQQPDLPQEVVRLGSRKGVPDALVPCERAAGFVGSRARLSSTSWLAFTSAPCNASRRPTTLNIRAARPLPTD